MAVKEIANAQMVIQVVPPAQGQVTIISQPSITVKAKGSGIYRGPLQFSVSNIKAPGLGMATPGTCAMGVIQPTAAVSKVDGQFVIRMGDRVDGLVSPDAQNPGPNGPIPSPITFSVEISSAGQTNVKAS